MAAYAALVEEQLKVKVDWLFGFNIPDGRINQALYSDAWRNRIHEVLGEIRTCIGSQLDPGPQPEGRICPDCPCANYCGDVW